MAVGEAAEEQGRGTAAVATVVGWQAEVRAALAREMEAGAREGAATEAETGGSPDSHAPQTPRS